MEPTEQALQDHLRTVVMAGLARQDENREQALKEYLAVMVPDMDITMSTRLASMVPVVLPDLYEKWVTMFTDRLFETVPLNQITHLCDGTPDNDATIGLVFLMFMESERMEKQIDTDLRAYGREHTGDPDMGNVVADYLRTRLAEMKKEGKG
jgi:hypothetical protein